MISVLGWSGVLLACVGALLLALRMPVAYLCGVVASALLTSHALARSDYRVMMVCIGAMMVCCFALWLRRRKRRSWRELTGARKVRGSRSALR